MQTVLVKDEEKITCWNSSDRDIVGAVYNRLSDVAGRKDPAEHVLELPPVGGQTPVEGPGRELFEEMVALIRNSDGELIPTWSGSPEKKVTDYEWWFE